MPDEKFIIRNADNSDLVSIKKIVFTVLKEYGLNPDEKGKDCDLNDIENSYFNNRGMFGVVTDNASTEIIGTFGVYVINKDVCELRKMYLLKHARGKGLGKLMFEASIDFARKRKFKRIVLETIAPLKEAISLYKKYGFREIPPEAINERVDRAFELII